MVRIVVEQAKLPGAGLIGEADDLLPAGMAPADMRRYFLVSISCVNNEGAGALGQHHGAFVERAVSQFDIGQIGMIGDAVMATFPTPDRALAAALSMRESVRVIKNDLLIKIGIHEGSCLAVTLNDRLDYFGQTVNIVARVQSLADS